MTETLTLNEIEVYYELYIGTIMGDFSYGDWEYETEDEAYADVSHAMENYGVDIEWQIFRCTKEVTRQSEGLNHVS